jgi:hypothetical protein
MKLSVLSKVLLVALLCKSGKPSGRHLGKTQIKFVFSLDLDKFLTLKNAKIICILFAKSKFCTTFDFVEGTHA